MENLSMLVVAPMTLYLICKYITLIKEPNMFHNFFFFTIITTPKKMVTVYDHENTYLKFLENTEKCVRKIKPLMVNCNTLRPPSMNN